MTAPERPGAPDTGTGPPGPEPGRGRRILGGAGGFLLGLFLGVLLSLGIAVARAHLQSVFVHSVRDLVGPLGLPILLLPALALALGMARPRALGRAALWAGLGLAVGVAAGVTVGALAGGRPTLLWAGAVLGAAAGGVLGAAAGALAGRSGAPGGPADGRAGPADRGAGPGTAAVALAALLLPLAAGLSACDGPRDDPADTEGTPPGPSRDAAEATEPPADSVPAGAVESVVLLLGDPGKARELHYPILARAQRDVERWSEALGPEGRVGVVFLGDLVYPDGLHPPDHPLRARDSLHLVAQIGLVAGPAARGHGAHAWFVAGNHDWGRQEDFEGAVRLERLARFLEAWRRETGMPVTLEPEAGTGGPSVVDVGRHLRLAFLDTAWWLLEGDGSAKEAVLSGVGRALEGAGGRRVVLAAHHPFESSGPHGGLRSPGATLGIGYLLARSGALLQDLNSGPYRALRRGLLEVFSRTGPPAVFAGGHEHSLQVLGPREAAAPRISLVSGSASKITSVEPRAESLFARSVPGYARLLVLRDGTLRLELEAAPRRYLRCPGAEDASGDEGASGAAGAPADEPASGVAGAPAAATDTPAHLRACLREGVEAFRTVWAGEL